MCSLKKVHFDFFTDRKTTAFFASHSFKRETHPSNKGAWLVAYARDGVEGQEPNAARLTALEQKQLVRTLRWGIKNEIDQDPKLLDYLVASHNVRMVNELCVNAPLLRHPGVYRKYDIDHNWRHVVLEMQKVRQIATSVSEDYVTINTRFVSEKNAANVPDTVCHELSKKFEAHWARLQEQYIALETPLTGILLQLNGIAYLRGTDFMAKLSVYTLHQVHRGLSQLRKDLQALLDSVESDHCALRALGERAGEMIPQATGAYKDLCVTVQKRATSVRCGHCQPHGRDLEEAIDAITDLLTNYWGPGPAPKSAFCDAKSAHSQQNAALLAENAGHVDKRSPEQTFASAVVPTMLEPPGLNSSA